MKRPTEDPLLDELLIGRKMDEFREASLRNALTVLHRTRQRRNVVRVLSLAALPVLLACWVGVGQFRKPAESKREVNVPAPAAIASGFESGKSTSVEFISDEELLALFPDKPLALVGPEGREQLVFLNQSMAN